MIPPKVLICFVVLSMEMIAPVRGVMADELGRLFTTPAERARLDRLRHGYTAQRHGSADAPMKTSARTIVLNGVMRRSDGHQALWLNGRHAGAKDVRPLGIALGGTIDADNRVTVRVPSIHRSVQIKPGQVLDTTNGGVAEAYQSGRGTPHGTDSQEGAAR